MHSTTQTIYQRVLRLSVFLLKVALMRLAAISILSSVIVLKFLLLNPVGVGAKVVLKLSGLCANWLSIIV